MVGISYHASAAMIQTDNYQTDTVTGLDWLDLRTTFNTSRADALLVNQGWRYATNDEVVGMTNSMFNAFYSGTPQSDGSRTIRTQTLLYSQVQTFTNYFGAYNSVIPMFTNLTDTTGYGSFGSYIDVNGRYMLFGTLYYNQRSCGGSGQSFSCSYTPYARISGTDYTGSLNGAVNPMVGTFLVRDPARDTVPEVPIPAAIWLFGTGLIALLGFARRKV